MKGGRKGDTEKGCREAPDVEGRRGWLKSLGDWDVTSAADAVAGLRSCSLGVGLPGSLGDGLGMAGGSKGWLAQSEQDAWPPISVAVTACRAQQAKHHPKRTQGQKTGGNRAQELGAECHIYQLPYLWTDVGGAVPALKLGPL